MCKKDPQGLEGDSTPIVYNLPSFYLTQTFFISYDSRRVCGGSCGISHENTSPTEVEFTKSID